jgi:hypothetical protein
VENGGDEHPDKVGFFTVGGNTESTVSREDLFTEDELQDLFRGFTNNRDRAFTMTLYESAARPGELLSRNIADFTSNAMGDFMFLEGCKGRSKSITLSGDSPRTGGDSTRNWPILRDCESCGMTADRPP